MNETPQDRACRELTAAVVALAVADLEHPRPYRRRAAAEWIASPGFAEWLEWAGVRITAAACRAALRRRGLLVG